MDTFHNTDSRLRDCQNLHATLYRVPVCADVNVTVSALNAVAAVSCQLLQRPASRRRQSCCDRGASNQGSSGVTNNTWCFTLWCSRSPQRPTQVLRGLDASSLQQDMWFVRDEASVATCLIMSVIRSFTFMRKEIDRLQHQDWTSFMIVSAWRWGLSWPTRRCAVARRLVRPSIVQNVTLVHQLPCTWTVSSSLHDQKARASTCSSASIPCCFR